MSTLRGALASRAVIHAPMGTRSSLQRKTMARAPWMSHEVELIASSDAACLRLRQIPGIGPLVATAIVASIGNGAAFHKGREFAAWMGLVPKRSHSADA